MQLTRGAGVIYTPICFYFLLLILGQFQMEAKTQSKTVALITIHGYLSVFGFGQHEKCLCKWNVKERERKKSVVQQKISVLYSKSFKRCHQQCYIIIYLLLFFFFFFFLGGGGLKLKNLYQNSLIQEIQNVKTCL